MKYDEKTFIEKARTKHNDKYDYSLASYVNSQTKVKIGCKIHGVFEQTPAMHLLRNGCPLCGIKRRNELNLKNLKWFIDKANIKHMNKYDYSEVNYVNSQSNVRIICPIHGVFEQRVNSHLNGRGCRKCGIKLRSFINSSNTRDFILNARKVHGSKYDYSEVIYQQNKKKVKIICPIHGIFLQLPNAHISGKQGCPICNESKGEARIRMILEESNLNFIKGKKFKECKNYGYLYFDFYLPDKNVLIEFDGIQHYKPINFFGGTDGLLKQKKCDAIKNDFAIKNNIKLLRIKYNQINSIYKVLENEKIIE